MGAYAGASQALSTQESYRMQAELEHERNAAETAPGHDEHSCLESGTSRSSSRDFGEHPARHALRLRWSMASGFRAPPIAPTRFGLPGKAEDS